MPVPLRPWLSLLLLLALVAPAAAQEVELTKALTQSADKAQGNLQDLNRKLAEDPEDAVSRRDLGITQCRVGLYKEAVETLDRALQALPDDPYCVGYRALSLQELERAGEAADAYERLAELLPEASGALRGRATLLRLGGRLSPEPPGDLSDEERTVLALLEPVDLGQNAPELGATLGAALRMGIGGSGEIVVLEPEETRAWLQADGRSLADFDDEKGQRRAARALGRRGVDAVLSSSYLRTEGGEIHYRLALLPLEADGLGAPVSLPTEPGQAGAEFAVLEPALGTVRERLGVETGGTDPLPAAAAALDHFQRARELFAAGDVAGAGEAFRRASAAGGGYPRFARWAEALGELDEVMDEALVARLVDTEPVVELLVEEAKAARRKARRSSGEF